MRIKEEIKRSGFFWLPSSPQNQIFGTLSISDGGDIKLELAQSLDPSIQAQLRATRPDSLNWILGHVEKDGPVLIDRCYRSEKKSSIVHGRLIAPDVIRAKRAFIGFQYEEDTSLPFNTLRFSVEGIDEWVGISGIEIDYEFEKRDITMSYNQPADISLNLHNGMQLLITFVPTFPGLPSTKSAEVSQKTYFKLVSQEARELDEFTSVAQKITAFLCFVMNEIVCLESMLATSDNLRQDFGDGRTAPIPVEIYCPSWPYAKDEPKINKFDMLFRFNDRQNRVESIINKWIENYEQIAPALDLYFLAKTGTLPSWNIQFLTLVQSLEAFHRKTSDEKHMDEDEFKEIRETLVSKCPKGERNWFAQKLNYANELTLKNRIEKMIEPFDFLIDNERRPHLVNSIKDTRNYLTHYDSELQPKAAKGKVLQFLCLKINALFRLHFLKIVGFDEQEINEIVDECPYLKGQCNS